MSIADQPDRFIRIEEAAERREQHRDHRVEHCDFNIRAPTGALSLDQSGKDSP